MYAYLEGPLELPDTSSVLVNCGGVGYHCRISLNTYEELKELAEARVYTTLLVKEDSLTLYGFASLEERRWFNQLINISGVGGNTALTLLSQMQTPELEEVIRQEDVARLKAVKGVGPKMAARLILELKSRLPQLAQAGPGTVSPVSQTAMLALTNLGFNPTEAEKRVLAVLKAEPAATVEDVIRQALKTT